VDVGVDDGEDEAVFGGGHDEMRNR
jgi:hypothetical protein